LKADRRFRRTRKCISRLMGTNNGWIPACAGMTTR
jgi:hypothetical protein